MTYRKLLFPSLALLLLFGSSIGKARLADNKTIVLYDAASGKLPDPSLMGFPAIPSDAVSISYANGATVLDTALSGMDAYAGWVPNTAAPGFPVLDRVAGIQVNFTLQLESETHASQDRAGFSVIILDRHARGVEISFWQNEIWAQNDDTTGGLFTHGEGVGFATTSDLADYQLTLNGASYTLTANTVPILMGSVRDYSNFEGFIDPYETPNFLFLGDDTTSAQARVRFSYVSVTGSEPIVSTQEVTATNTGLPQPTASLTLPARITPVSSLTPAPPQGIDVCPSGWLLTIVISTIIVRRKSRTKTYS